MMGVTGVCAGTMAKKKVPRISLLLQQRHKLFRTTAQCLSTVHFSFLPRRLGHLLVCSSAFCRKVHTWLNAASINISLNNTQFGNTNLAAEAEESLYFNLNLEFLSFLSVITLWKVKTKLTPLCEVPRAQTYAARCSHPSPTDRRLLSPAHGCHSPLAGHVLLVVVHALPQLQDTIREVLIDVLTPHICSEIWVPRHDQEEEGCRTDTEDIGLRSSEVQWVHLQRHKVMTYAKGGKIHSVLFSFFLPMSCSL